MKTLNNFPENEDDTRIEDKVKEKYTDIERRMSWIGEAER
jgi:hypothetical protein